MKKYQSFHDLLETGKLGERFVTQFVKMDADWEINIYIGKYIILPTPKSFFNRRSPVLSNRMLYFIE